MQDADLDALRDAGATSKRPPAATAANNADFILFLPELFCQRNLTTLVNNPVHAHPFRISQKYGGARSKLYPSFRGARSANPESNWPRHVP